MADPPAELVNPFHSNNFLVKWHGKYVAAVTSVSGLTRRTAVVSFHAGGQPQSALRIPGQTDYEPVRLERGITTDTAFQDWANLLWDYPNTQRLGNETQLATFRRPMQIELYDQQRVLAVRYSLYHCWPKRVHRGAGAELRGERRRAREHDDRARGLGTRHERRLHTGVHDAAVALPSVFQPTGPGGTRRLAPGGASGSLTTRIRLPVSGQGESMPTRSGVGGSCRPAVR